MARGEERTDRLEVFSARRAPNRLKYLDASESGVGAFINDVPPEEAARLLHNRLRAS